MSASQAILSGENVTKNFGGLTAVDRVTFTLDQRHTKSLIGPNGAGKTTFLNCISGLLDISGGEIVFDGENVTNHGAHEMAERGLGRTFQVTNLFSDFTVYENVRLATQIHAENNFNFWKSYGSLESVEEMAHEVLDLLEIESDRHSVVDTLSHGEKRKLEIGVVLATGPELLLLDEPTAGMASEEIGRVTNLVQDIKDEYAIILVEHNIDVVMELSDTIMVLHQGQKIADGAPEDVRGDEGVRDAYLGTEREAA